MNRSLRGSDLIDEISSLQVPQGAIALWWLGQASVALRIGDTTVYIDPFLSDSSSRLVPPPCNGDQVTNADVVLLTHGHSDHLDVGAIPLIARASPDASFVAPGPLVSQVAELVGSSERVLAADPGTSMLLGNLGVVTVMAKHEEFDRDPALGYPYLGYVLRNRTVSLYHAGDTIPYDGLVDTLAPLGIHLALLPINGRDYFRGLRGIAGNMDAREAAEVASRLNVDTVIPIHYGMFAGNTTSPGPFVEHLQSLAPHAHALLPGLGRACIYHPPA